MISSRQLLKKSGISIFIVLFIVGLVKDYLIVPIMTRIWGWTLMTTPDGYVSNANTVSIIVRCPWILLIGIGLVLIYSLIALWEACAAILGIAYAYHGQNVKLVDLVRISLTRVQQVILPKNMLILVYAAIILPFSNFYQASEMIGAFVVPEYIEDYINSKLWLWGLYTVIGLFVIYLVLRWMYLLPAFVMKNKGFYHAHQDSMALTKKGWFRNGIKIGVYEFAETMRLGIIPFLMVTGVCIACLYATFHMKYAMDLMANIGLTLGYQMVGTLVGRLVYISLMCYLVFGYVKKLELADMDTDFDLPELTRQSKQHHSIVFAEIWLGLLIALFVVALYLPIVSFAQADESIAGLFHGKTEIIAHKGYSSKAPENTMPAFELADQSVCTDFIELDVWSAKDGVPVVVHNETITAATGLKGYVYDYTSEELHQIPAPYTSDLTAFPDAYIPTLEEVLAAYVDHTPILIEIKGYQQDSKLAEKIVALMDQYNCKESCMIHSQDYQALRAVKMLDSNIRCGLIMAFVTGDCYDLPYADFFSLEHTFITQTMVNQLHLRGKRVYVWTVNHSGRVEKLRSLGVDGIITDYPDDMEKSMSNLNELIGELLNVNLSDIGDIPESSYENGDF